MKENSGKTKKIKICLYPNLSSYIWQKLFDVIVNKNLGCFQQFFHGQHPRYLMLEISLAKLTLADRWMDSGGCKKLVCDCFLCLSIQAWRADCEWTKHFMDVASDRGQNFYKE